jgi:cytochrome c biogenesis protein CcmG, thiol:disulfide interchange protein DsbE
MTPALLARLAALLAGLLLAGCGERAVPGAAVGERFPELRLAALGDARKQGGPLPALAPAGRDVVLNVWATWCEPCRKEMASLEALARARGRDLEVVGLSVDEDANLAREFLLKQGVSFANFNDPGGRVALDVLGVSALPQTFVIARDGTLVARITGPRDWAGDEIRVAVRDALAVANGRTR